MIYLTGSVMLQSRLNTERCSVSVEQLRGAVWRDLERPKEAAECGCSHGELVDPGSVARRHIWSRRRHAALTHSHCRAGTLASSPHCQRSFALSFIYLCTLWHVNLALILNRSVECWSVCKSLFASRKHTASGYQRDSSCLPWRLPLDLLTPHSI